MQPLPLPEIDPSIGRCLAHGVTKRRLGEQRAPRGRCGRRMKRPTKPSSADAAVAPWAASSAWDVPDGGGGQLKGFVYVRKDVAAFTHEPKLSCSPVPTRGCGEHQLRGAGVEPRGLGTQGPRDIGAGRFSPTLQGEAGRRHVFLGVLGRSSCASSRHSVASGRRRARDSPGSSRRVPCGIRLEARVQEAGADAR